MTGGGAGPLGEDFIERVTRNAVAAVVAVTALCLGTAAWFAPSMAAYLNGGTAPGRGPHLGSLAMFAVCVACAWFLTPEDAESPHPVLSRVSAVVRRGGMAAIVIALVTCLGANVGH